MDLLDSILVSMDKPPSLSERERKIAKDQKIKWEEEEKKMREWRNSFKTSIEKQIGKFLNDPLLKRSRLPPANKLARTIIYEVSEAAGVIAQSFGVDDDKYIILFKKEYPPSEKELTALRNGLEYDPTKEEVEVNDVPCDNERLHPDSTKGQDYRNPSNYQEKYRKLLGGLECAEKSAVKMQPNKSFGYVPSANKRDLRSIEQTLNDMKSRKKPKMDPDSLDKTGPPPAATSE